jgi:hypothetical protein
MPGVAGARSRPWGSASRTNGRGGTAARTSPWVRGHGPATWRSHRALSDEFTVVAWDAFAVVLDRPQVSGARRHALTSPSTPQTGLRALCPLQGVRQNPHRHLYCKTSSGLRAGERDEVHDRRRWVLIDRTPSQRGRPDGRLHKDRLRVLQTQLGRGVSASHCPDPSASG